MNQIIAFASPTQSLFSKSMAPATLKIFNSKSQFLLYSSKISSIGKKINYDQCTKTHCLVACSHIWKIKISALHIPQAS